MERLLLAASLVLNGIKRQFAGSGFDLAVK
jgi:hypothetical protein